MGCIATTRAGRASFDYLALATGSDVLQVSELTGQRRGEKVWASDPANGPGCDPVKVGQAFEDEHTVSIDAMDKDFCQDRRAPAVRRKASEGDAARRARGHAAHRRAGRLGRELRSRMRRGF